MMSPYVWPAVPLGKDLPTGCRLPDTKTQESKQVKWEEEKEREMKNKACRDTSLGNQP